MRGALSIENSLDFADKERPTRSTGVLAARYQNFEVLCSRWVLNSNALLNTEPVAEVLYFEHLAVEISLQISLHVIPHACQRRTPGTL